MKAPFLALLFFIGLKPLISIAQTTNTQAQSRSSEATSPLSAPERDLLNEINDARAHPQIYASYLEKLKPLFGGKEYWPTGHRIGVC